MSSLLKTFAPHSVQNSNAQEILICVTTNDLLTFISSCEKTPKYKQNKNRVEMYIASSI